MGHRLSKIYTRTGDAGITGLGDGTRVSKESRRVEAYGTVDELNSIIGMVLANPLPDTVAEDLVEVQHQLFDLGGELCIPGHQSIHNTQIEWLEHTLDRHNADLPALKEFILPGGSPAAASCHLARTVCRRAEREVIRMAREESVNETAIAYLNRLSDLLFVLARVLARADGGSEVLWRHERASKPVGKG